MTSYRSSYENLLVSSCCVLFLGYPYVSVYSVFITSAFYVVHTVF